MFHHIWNVMIEKKLMYFTPWQRNILCDVCLFMILFFLMYCIWRHMKRTSISTEQIDKTTQSTNIKREEIIKINIINNTFNLHNSLLNNDNRYMIFVTVSHQTGLDTRPKARRPIKVGIKGRGRSGTSRDSNPASHWPTKYNVALMSQAVSRT